MSCNTFIKGSASRCQPGRESPDVDQRRQQCSQQFYLGRYLAAGVGCLEFITVAVAVA